jgi:hypothetical protein
MFGLLKEFFLAAVGRAVYAPAVHWEALGEEAWFRPPRPGLLPLLRVVEGGAGSFISGCLFFPKGRKALPCSHTGRNL